LSQLLPTTDIELGLLEGQLNADTAAEAEKVLKCISPISAGRNITIN
jgi:hypothetical protein